MIAAAAKLHSLVVHLAARAQFLYSGGFANPEAADTQVTVDTSAGGAAGTAEPQQQRREQVIYVIVTVTVVTTCTLFDTCMCTAWFCRKLYVCGHLSSEAWLL